MFPNRRAVSIPIILGVISLGLSVALLVGWILVIVKNLSVTHETAQNTWLLVLGSVSFAVIITVLTLFSVFLAREITLVDRQTRFVDSVTHELRSPLSSLKLCLETMERGNLSAPQRDSLQRMMSDDVERLSILIDHVLEANRLTHTRQSFALEHVPLRQFVESCVPGILRYHKQEANAITNRVPADLVLITDRRALETVIKNLLDNAVKYSARLERPVEVTVDARLEPPYVHIEIRDRGIGIPKKHLKRIFRRFYRVPTEEVQASHGTGLGLYVVSMLVRLLGGKLRIHSDGPGRGVSVRLRIPAQSEKVARGSTREAPGKPGDEGRPTTDTGTGRRG